MPGADQTYSAFKSAIRGNDVENAASLLIELANRFSNNEQYQSEAVSLKTEYFLAPDIPEAKIGLINDMLDLAESIVHSKGEAAEVEDYGRIEENWRERRKNKEIVFTGENVCKAYLKSGFALQNINLVLKAGDIYGVVGENGNGKTTLLKIIAGELRPQHGKITYGVQQHNLPANWIQVKKNIAYLPQELGRLEGSVKQSIQYEAALHGITGRKNDREVEYIIQRLGLGSYKSAQWEELSGGYKLRFALAKTLVWKPKLLILDEPLANLDINTQIRVLNDLSDLAKSIKNPIAVVLSSQNIEEVEAAADHMIVLKNGEMLYNDQTAEIGEYRKENIFEFKCQCSWQELEKRLGGFTFDGLDHNGFSFYIRTPLHVTKDDFLRHCIQHGISLKFFQDISLSTKRFIVQTSFS